MTGAEQLCLLLCADLGDGIPPLSLSRYKQLQQFAATLPHPSHMDSRLTGAALEQHGLSHELAEQVELRLSRVSLLDAYLNCAAYDCITPLTMLSAYYPLRWTQQLGQDRPPVLFMRGDAGLLVERHISLVGSRDLRPQNEEFSRAIGQLVAREGCVLVSGNARGADQAAQQACLDAGGRVISIVATPLEETVPQQSQLLLCETGFQLPFSPFRALSRNRLIHALGEMVIVAQTSCGQGGTWGGTIANLRRGWSPVYVFDDGSEGAALLMEQGAEPLTDVPASLQDLSPSQCSFL